MHASLVFFLFIIYMLSIDLLLEKNKNYTKKDFVNILNNKNGLKRIKFICFVLSFSRVCVV